METYLALVVFSILFVTTISSSELSSDPHCLWRWNNGSLQCSVNSLADNVNFNLTAEEEGIENKVRELIIDCREISREEESPSLILRLLPRLTHLSISRCGKVRSFLSGRRSPVPLTSLSLRNNSIIALPPAFLSSFPALRSLDLTSNSLSSLSIKGNLFGTNERLAILRLSSNRLSYIDNEVFSSLVSLNSLYLDGNSLESFHVDAFTALKSLKLLDLSRNRFISIQPFNNPSLRHLFIDHNRLANLPEGTFAKLGLLEDLGLSGNIFPHIPSVINEALNLKTVDIGDNRISSAEGFSNLTQLYGLRLAGNRLEEIPTNLCESLINLRVLNVAENKLRRIENFKCPTLTALRLDSNSITKLSLESAFESLLWLNASMNKIEVFKTNIDSLEWLDVSFNRLPQVELDTLTNLRVVDVSHNKIQNVKSIPPNVEIFLASTNLISELRLGETPLLKKMDLRNNKLNHVPETSHRAQMFVAGNPLICSCLIQSSQHIADLNDVHCNSDEVSMGNSVCPYKSVCPAGCGCCEFEACDCALTCPDACTCVQGIGINVIRCSRISVSNLPQKIPMDSTELWLDGNSFSTLLPHGFIGKRRLETLYLNSSRIEEISNRSFNGLKSLTRIHLERNRLTRVGHEFQDTPSIQFIYLQYNEISFIAEGAFSTLTELKLINLEGNSIAQFTLREFGIQRGVQLAIGGNPASCECHLRNEVKERTEVEINFGQCEPCNESIEEKREERFVEEESSAVFWTMVLSILISGTALLSLFLIVLKHILDGAGKDKLGSCFGRDVEVKNEKLFDAYFLYSKKDEDGMVNKISNYLERSNGDRLCLHFRDLPLLGYPWSPELMVGAMGASRIVLVLLTHNLYTECGFFDALARARAASPHNESPPLYFIIGEGGRNGGRLPPDLNSLDPSAQTFWADLKGVMSQGRSGTKRREIGRYLNHTMKEEDQGSSRDHIYSSLDSPHSNSTTETSYGGVYLV